MKQPEFKYLAIRNWSKFQDTKDKHGRSLEGRHQNYIKDWTEKETDSLYAELSMVGRYLIDACRRLRGRYGRNLLNDYMWVIRQLDVAHSERGRGVVVLQSLVSRGFLIPTNEQFNVPDLPDSPSASDSYSASASASESASLESIRLDSTRNKAELKKGETATPTHSGTPSPNPGPTDSDIELANVALHSARFKQLPDEDQDMLLFCHKLSQHSSVSVKPSWIGPGRELFCDYPRDLIWPLLSWIFDYQKKQPGLKFYWANCTKSTKNFRDHMNKGAIITQYRDFEKEQAKQEEEKVEISDEVALSVSKAFEMEE